MRLRPPATERVLPEIEHTIGPLRQAILDHLLGWTAERRAASRRDARRHRRALSLGCIVKLHALDIPTPGRVCAPWPPDGDGIPARCAVVRRAVTPRSGFGDRGDLAAIEPLDARLGWKGLLASTTVHLRGCSGQIHPTRTSSSVCWRMFMRRG